MTPRDILYRRLANQQIARPKYRTPREMVAWLGAMQAQDYLGALWAIGLRLPNVAEADVEQAIANRTIVRTWPLRGTLHFVAAVDIRWMLELLAPRVIASGRRRQQQLELDDKIIGRIRTVFVRALQGGKQLTETRCTHYWSRRESPAPANVAITFSGGSRMREPFAAERAKANNQHLR